MAASEKMRRKKILEKAFTEVKRGGAEKLRLRTADSVVGLNEREILKITAKSPRSRSFNVKFKNNVSCDQCEKSFPI